MVAHTIDRQTALERTFAAAFHALDETRDPQVVSSLYETIVRHIRSANPMALLGAADVIEPVAEVIVPLADGARVEIRKMDGKVNLYLHDAMEHDADVGLTAAEAEAVCRALRAVQA